MPGQEITIMMSVISLKHSPSEKGIVMLHLSAWQNQNAVLCLKHSHDEKRMRHKNTLSNFKRFLRIIIKPELVSMDKRKV